MFALVEPVEYAASMAYNFLSSRWNHLLPSLVFLALLSSFLPLKLLPTKAAAEDRENSSFYPTWKLLKPSERKLFLSGYLHGWRDSRRVTEIVKSHVEKNPGSAVASLEKIQQIYDTADMPIELLVERLTVYYSAPENRDAPLSVAVSAVK